jgi:hypothetical protein
MVFAPASIPDDHTLTTNALKGAYEMEAAMANLTMSSTAQAFIKPPGSTDETEKDLRKAIDDVAAKFEAHERARASRSQPDDGADTPDEESMSDGDDISDEDEMSNEKPPDKGAMFDQHENAGPGKARAPIKLKLFWKAPQIDDTGIKAITEGMNEHSLGADEYSTGTNNEISRGRPLQRQSPELQRSTADPTRQSNSAIGPSKQEDDRDERSERDKGRLIRRVRGKNAIRTEPDNHHRIGEHHRIGGTRSTSGGQQAQTASDQDAPLYMNGHDRTNDPDADDSPLVKPDDSDEDMHDNKTIELLGIARLRRRSFEVEAEDYDDRERFVDADGGEHYGGYEDDEGDEEDGDVDWEEEDDEENEEAKLNNKYGWSQPQSDRIRFPPPPHQFTTSQSSSSHLEEPAGESVTKSVETGVSEEQINKGLAEELRRTKLDETQPDPQQ